MRAFAIGGTAFFAVTFAGAAVGIRRRSTLFDHDLYRRLALRPVADDEVRRLARVGEGPVFRLLACAAVSTAMLLAAIATMSTTPLIAAAAVVAVSVVVTIALPASASYDDLLAHLGLHVVLMPTSPVDGVEILVELRGERHGRPVLVRHGTHHATTEVGDGVMTREGNGAGRHLLADLLTAEQRASLPSAP